MFNSLNNKSIKIGVDIVHISRIEKIYYKDKENFAKKILTAEEIKTYNCFISEKRKIRYLALRFAAKEAVSKALGHGIGVINWHDICILNNNAGKPYIIFNKEKLLKIGYNTAINFDISLADDYPTACAFVVLWE